MIPRNTLVTLILLLAGTAAGFLLSVPLVDYLSISVQEKELPQIHDTDMQVDTAGLSLPLRMVDLGGVGIIPDTAGWGSDYGHNQYVFREVIRPAPPYLNRAALEAEKGKLEQYAGLMTERGFNAVSFPLFLELVNFDRVGDGTQVYGLLSVYRSRHDTLAAGFGQLMELADKTGLAPYLWTDMVTLTPPLESFFMRRFGKLDPEDPAFWEVYEKAAEEVFEEFPVVEGIILRIGEAGSVYNIPGWDYRSELLVRTDSAVRLMLGAFLRAAEKHDRTIVFRTWSVGVGSAGDLHTNPETYRRVLGSIRSDHLVVSTKYCEGDFYSWLPFNATLFTGEHRRIIEFQTKREFEGFGAIPNYLGPLHQAAVRAALDGNPQLEGAWVWTQNGGPLRAGPMIIYPFHGFNVVNDLNVYATARVLEDPFLPVDSITVEWIRSFFGSDRELVEGLTEAMNSSYGIMLHGLYIGQFAQYSVRALGLEPPPMLWIFEWDILGASSSVFSNLYFITRDHFQEVLDEGFEAVRGAVALKEKLLEVRGSVTLHREEFEQLIAAAGYEIELFRLLDYYRQYMMHFYRWTDTGDPREKSAFMLSMGQFRAVADFHQQKFEGNLNTLGMNLEEAMRGMRVAENSFSSIRWARVALVLAFFLLLMGIPGFIRPRGHRLFAASCYFDALFRPRMISSLHSFHSLRTVAMIMASLFVLGWLIFSSFTARWFPVAIALLTLIYILVLGTVTRWKGGVERTVIGLLATRLMILALFLVPVAIRGPQFFWYLFWTSDPFKMAFISLLVMLIVRKYQVDVQLVRKWSGRGFAGSLGVVLLGHGIRLLVTGTWLQLTGLEKSLTVLNDELLVLPGGLSRIMGITTHLGIPSALPRWIMAGAAAVSLIAVTLVLLSRRFRSR